MPVSINETYVKQTFDALSNSQLSTGFVASRITQLPVREQIRFFKLAIDYIDILAEQEEKGYTKMGLQEIVRACGELMEVVELHFPNQEVQETLPGMEYIQL